MVTDDLRAFRSKLASPPPRAEARARSRLEGLIAAEAAGARPRPRSQGRKRTAAYALAAAVLASGLAGAATGLLRQELRPPDSARVEAEGGAGNRTVWRFRSEQPDGLLAALPSLEGKDAGTRPTSDRGGWSECGITECYLQS